MDNRHPDAVVPLCSVLLTSFWPCPNAVVPLCPVLLTGSVLKFSLARLKPREMITWPCDLFFVAVLLHMSPNTTALEGKLDFRHLFFEHHDVENVNACSERNRTPLLMLLDNKNIEIVCLQLEHEVDTNIRVNKDQTALHLVPENEELEIMSPVCQACHHVIAASRT